MSTILGLGSGRKRGGGLRRACVQDEKTRLGRFLSNEAAGGEGEEKGLSSWEWPHTLST